MSGQPTATPTPPTPSKGLSNKAMIVIAVVLGIGVWTYVDNQPSGGPYVAFGRPGVTEAGHITVTGTLTNLGDEGSPTCDVEFRDSDGFLLSGTSWEQGEVPANAKEVPFSITTGLVMGSTPPASALIDCS